MYIITYPLTIQTKSKMDKIKIKLILFNLNKSALIFNLL